MTIAVKVQAVCEKCIACNRALKTDEQSILITRYNPNLPDGWIMLPGDKFSYASIGPTCYKGYQNRHDFHHIDINFDVFKKFDSRKTSSLERYAILRQALLPAMNPYFKTTHEALDDILHEIVDNGKLNKLEERARNLATNVKLYPKLNPDNLAISYINYTRINKLIESSLKDERFLSGINSSLIKNGYLTSKQIDAVNNILNELPHDYRPKSLIKF